MRRRGVARGSGIDHGDPAPSPAQHEGRAEAGRSAADHHDVVDLCLGVVHRGLILRVTRGFGKAAPTVDRAVRPREEAA